MQVEDEYGIAIWDSQAPPVMASFNLAGADGTQRASKMMVAADKKTRNVCGGVVAVVNFLVHGVRLIDKETFSEAKRVRCVLELDDGTTVSIMSEPCIKSLAFIMRGRKSGPFDPPVYLEFKEVPCGKEKSYCVCWEIPQPTFTKRNRGKNQSEE